MCTKRLVKSAMCVQHTVSQYNVVCDLYVVHACTLLHICVYLVSALAGHSPSTGLLAMTFIGCTK